jgi:FemAB-related protein (PEP-CTERM system-associated)
MRIIRCDYANQAGWTAFVDASSGASFYHRWEWRGLNERYLGHDSCYLAALDDDRVVGILPVVQVKSRLFGNIGCSMPFVNYGGPVAGSEAIDSALLAAASGVAAEWGVDYLEIRSTRDLGQQYPCSRHKVSMTVELAPDPDVLFKAFKGDQRKEIKRGYKWGFTARFGTTTVFEDFYAILCDSWRDLGTPIYSKEYFQAVVSTFPAQTRIAVVYAADGTPAAAAFMGHQNGVVEGLWLGTRAQYRRQLVGYVLYWEIIKDACEQGHRLFHLGRSTADSGAEQFKRKWNAHPTQLYWHYILRTRKEIPQLNVTNPKFKMAIAAWRKLPVGVTRYLGPLIARSIP